MEIKKTKPMRIRMEDKRFNMEIISGCSKLGFSYVVEAIYTSRYKMELLGPGVEKFRSSNFANVDMEYVSLCRIDDNIVFP